MKSDRYFQEQAYCVLSISDYDYRVDGYSCDRKSHKYQPIRFADIKDNRKKVHWVVNRGKVYYFGFFACTSLC